MLFFFPPKGVERLFVLQQGATALAQHNEIELQWCQSVTRPCFGCYNNNFNKMMMMFQIREKENSFSFVVVAVVGGKKRAVKGQIGVWPCQLRSKQSRHIRKCSSAAWKFLFKNMMTTTRATAAPHRAAPSLSAAREREKLKIAYGTRGRLLESGRI